MAKKKAAKKKAVKKKAVKKKAARTFYENDFDVRKDKCADWERLFAEKQTAEAALKLHRAMLEGHPEVSGFHVGLKRKQGKIVYPLKYVICIHVDVKRSLDDSNIGRLLPNSLSGAETDVIQMCYKSVAGEDLRQPQNTLEGGVAISSQASPNKFGTLGFVVDFANEMCYLTNQHVAGDKGTQIRQPPIQTSSSLRTIGEVLRSEITATYDAALILSNSTGSPSKTLRGFTASPSDISEGLLTGRDENRTEVVVFGAATGPVFGIVESVSAGGIRVDGTGVFQQQIIIRSKDGTDITEKGNSGAIVAKPVNENGTTRFQIVGLVHAETADKQKVVAAHFHRVADDFNIFI